jgi:hypothetical protein
MEEILAENRRMREENERLRAEVARQSVKPAIKPEGRSIRPTKREASELPLASFRRKRPKSSQHEIIEISD